MDVKKLRYFLEISETLNITKAAENLHMSQPPLTYQLKLLEEELGTKLFTRTTRKLVMTEAGEKLKVRAHQILELMETTENEVRQIQFESNEIQIGFVASSAALLSPDKLLSFHKLYPSMKFIMKEGNTHKILDLLNHGLIDVGFVRTPFNAEIYNVEYLEPEPMIVVYDPKVYQLDEKIGVKDLKNLPLVLDKRFLELIENEAFTSGVRPNIICLGEDSRSILAWTEAGLGVAILPFSGKSFIRSSKLKYAIINSKSLETRSAIVTLKNKDKSMVDDLIDIIK
ncbi:LysR family transcriptional regulator [Acidaminobacter sp. JC074]|uniref:LysR family transcriptional regulator n=1 Tax=Acidaminobacter sp. JC074 TaxID=2530199 RepID=UPI001F0DA328|nr:LysR family transcriptional regulator [Acidaminobacter sp. JC074]